jgi:hypothetical protein
MKEVREKSELIISINNTLIISIIMQVGVSGHSWVIRERNFAVRSIYLNKKYQNCYAKLHD